jgi:hypothetical protein
MHQHSVKMTVSNVFFETIVSEVYGIEAARPQKLTGPLPLA